MDSRTEIRVRGLEGRAAMLERHADEREARTPRMSRLGGYEFFAAIEKSEQDRNEARKLRTKAAQLRRQNSCRATNPHQHE